MKLISPAGFAAAATALLLSASAATATCWCVSPPGSLLQWTGQLNLVVRDGDHFRLVPNIRINGSADDFALIVPTPSLPALAPVDGALWDEAADLTKPVTRTTLDAGGCWSDTVVKDAALADSRGPAVAVHSVETVGSFEATIVSSTHPDSLVTWLTNNGYLPDPDHVAAFTPLVTDGWYFTCMKLLPGTPVPANGWNNSVDPVELTFAADEFVLPLGALSINASPFGQLGIGVYAVDDRRMDIPGFRTSYANSITARELRAIRERYPTLAPYLAEGRTFTFLSRFFIPDELTGELAMQPADTDEEVRAGLNARTVPGDFLMLLGLILGLAWRSARWRMRAAVSAAA